MGMLNINQKQVEEVMKRMGIKQEEIDVRRVIFELEDVNLVIDEPEVTKVVMQGKETFQVSGDVREEKRESFSEEDLKLVMEKTQASRSEVENFLKENNGDIAMAIIELKKK